MNSRNLHPGDRVEVNRKGEHFTARLSKKLDDGRWLCEDPSPRSTYLHLRPRWIVGVVTSQQRLEAA